jgi:hypothetical protein
MKTIKDKLEAGNKKRAGHLISSFIRSVAQEKVAGEDTVITRAEALARLLWDMALGRSKVVDMETGKITTEYSSPDKHAMDVIIDRMEGRVGSFEDEKKKSESIPDKISRKNKNRINKLSKKSE